MEEEGAPDYVPLEAEDATTAATSLKRTISGGDLSADDAPKAKKKKKKASSPDQPVPPKNALMQLNEIKPGLGFILTGQTGPVHAPTFTMTVEVNGFKYQGSGTTKKKAKLMAAEKALTAFVQLPNVLNSPPTDQQLTTSDFTADAGDDDGNMFQNFQPPNEGASNGGSSISSPKGPPPPRNPPSSSAQQPIGKNPIMILNEMRPGVKFEFVSESGESQSKSFVMSVSVEGETFQVSVLCCSFHGFDF